ncbi:MAG: outer membrane lipoprotein-sorting protein [Treponema sp.]|nr:outer membrane lipoprotein-sorting protein [Treponema sp.]
MKITKIISACAALMVGTAAFAIDGRTVVKMALDVAEPDTTHAVVYMDLITVNKKTGEESTERRAIEEFGKSVNGLETITMVFQAPASVKNTRYMQKEVEGSDDDKWIYMPSLGGDPRKLAASNGGDSFMGSDATYDDMSTRELDDDSHELLAESESKNGYTCYKVKSTPIPSKAKDSQYSYRIQWIDKATNVPVYAEMYDKKGELVKVLTVEKLEKKTGKTGKTYDIPVSTLLHNVQKNHKTRMIMGKLELDAGVPAKYFSQSFLKNGK